MKGNPNIRDFLQDTFLESTGKLDPAQENQLTAMFRNLDRDQTEQFLKLATEPKKTSYIDAVEALLNKERRNPRPPSLGK